MKKSLKILEYNAVFTSEKDGGYSVTVPELPGCFAEGETFEEAQKNIGEAIELYLQAEPAQDLDLLTDQKDQFMAPIRVQLAL